MFIPRAFLSLSLALTSLVGTVNPHPMAFQTAKDAAVVAMRRRADDIALQAVTDEKE